MGPVPWRPEAGEAQIPDDEARERGRDYLSDELAKRLRDGPAGFELLFQIPAEGDPIDDATAVWPEDRELVVAGRLEISEIVDDPESGDHIEVFDPTRIVDGIELSNDPILQARARASRSRPTAGWGSRSRTRRLRPLARRPSPGRRRA